MLQSDYLVRMFTELATAIRESILRARGEDDPDGAAVMLEAAFSEATEMDGSMLLTLAPESMVSMMQISGTDPALVGYLSRTLLLESRYLQDAHNSDLSMLRHDQAHALAQAYGFSLSDESVSPEELETFFEFSDQGHEQ